MHPRTLNDFDILYLEYGRNNVEKLLVEKKDDGTLFSIKLLPTSKVALFASTTFLYLEVSSVIVKRSSLESVILYQS